MKLFSNRSRPVHLGPFPLERLKRAPLPPADSAAGPRPARLAPRPAPAAGGFDEVAWQYLKLFEQFRDGKVAPQKAPIALDPEEITRDLKAGAYFIDAAMVGACTLPEDAWYSTGEDGKPLAPYHRFALVVLAESGRGIEADNPASAWVAGADANRDAMRATEIACVLAGYIRNLGWTARAHTRDLSDVDLEALVVRAGLGERKGGAIVNPYIGTRFAPAAVTTDLPLEPDAPLASGRGADRDLRYWLGVGGAVPGLERAREARRASHLSRYPMEAIKTAEKPTTLVIEKEVPRVSKRAAFFERALRGDLGEKAQRERTRFAIKHPFTFAMTGLMRAMVPLQDGQVAPRRAPDTDDPARNARAVKSLSYYLNSDLTGICEIPRFAWFSHKDDGTPIEPYHKYAIVMLTDQGYETMEGASGDDWISGSQSMRGYMRGAEIVGIMAAQIRNLGYSARAHTNIDSDVLHIPLILYAGLGEMSRIGELVLNPFVGPRFKSAVITTDMPLAVDRMIDFGLQDMCEKCLKCARECPCDAIPWGDKVMFNGYEIWKPDAERCTRYRVTNPKGAACGRCMKTCPYNHEGLLYHRLFLWLAIHVPFARKWIADLDDKVGHGRRNPVKKWWRDLEWLREGYAVEPKAGTNQRDLDLGKELDPSKQKIAYYHANMMPVPNVIEPQPVDRKAALAACALLETPAEARARLTQGKPAPAHYAPTAPADRVAAKSEA